MKKYTFILLAILFSYHLSGQLEEDVQTMEILKQPPLGITIDLFVVDAAKQMYRLDWTDTLSRMQSSSQEDRFYELHCYIRDSKGFAGYYDGKTVLATHCDFTTTEQNVEVFFRLRTNYTEDEVRLFMRFDDEQQSYTEFRKITLPLQPLDDQKIVLKNSNDVVLLVYRSKYALYPDPMPCIANCLGGDVMNLSRYYISLKTGRIKKLNNWLNFHSIKMVTTELQMEIIDPAKTYSDKNGITYLGKELIKARKISQVDFDFEQFRVGYDYFPY